MKRLAIWVALLTLMALALPVQAGPPVGAYVSPPSGSLLVTPEQARTVATNWIATILYYEGKWGDASTAQVAEVREFKRGSTVLGYFCRVEPHGYIIVPLRKELGAVKAYSDTTILNPDAEEGLTDLLKDSLERLTGWVEQLAGPIETAPPDALDRILEINYLPAWDELTLAPQALAQSLAAGNYTGGEPPLLSTHWEQGKPFNCQAPASSDCGGVGAYYDGRCAAGCIATAGAQVMKYWAWPPDEYLWPIMPDRLAWSVPCSDDGADEVARLMHNVGVEAGMDYCDDGCESAAYFASHNGKDLLDAFEDHFSYSSDGDDKYRDDYSAVAWFEEIKSQLNVNRPLPYATEDHALVCDGWKEEGSTPDRYYHFNYGWGQVGVCQDGCDTWYLLDGMWLHDYDEEEMIVRLFPDASLKWEVSGEYRPEECTGYVCLPAPYRYFDRDCWGDDATFQAGHLLQFLPGVRVECSGARIRFFGWSDSNTELYTQTTWHQGIHIYSGHIYLYKDGGIRLY